LICENESHIGNQPIEVGVDIFNEIPDAKDMNEYKDVKQLREEEGQLGAIVVWPFEPPQKQVFIHEIGEQGTSQPN